MHLINPLNKILSILLVWTFLSTDIAYPGIDTLRPMLPFGTKEGQERRDSEIPGSISTVVTEVKSFIETITKALLSREYITENEVGVAQDSLRKLFTMDVKIAPYLLPLTADARAILYFEMEHLKSFFNTLSGILTNRDKSDSSDVRKLMDAKADKQLENIRGSIERINRAVADLENWLQRNAVARSAGAGVGVDPNTKFQTEEQQLGEQALILYEPLIGAKFHLDNEEVEVELLKTLYRLGWLEPQISGIENRFYFTLGMEKIDMVLTLLLEVKHVSNRKIVQELIDAGRRIAVIIPSEKADQQKKSLEKDDYINSMLQQGKIIIIELKWEDVSNLLGPLLKRKDVKILDISKMKIAEILENQRLIIGVCKQFQEVINPDEMLSKLPVSRCLVWGIKRLKSMFPEDKKELTIDDIYWLKPVLRDVDRLAKALIEELLGTGVIEYEEVGGLSGSLSDAFRPFESFSIKRDVDAIRNGIELLEKWYENIPERLIRQAEATDISGQQGHRSAGAAAGVVSLSMESAISLLSEQIEYLKIISGDKYELTADDYKLILEVEKPLIELRKDLLMSGILDDAEGGYIKHNLDSAIEILNSTSLSGLKTKLRLPERVEILTEVRNAIFQLKQAYDRMRRTAIIGQQRKLLIRRYRIPDSSL